MINYNELKAYDLPLQPRADSNNIGNDKRRDIYLKDMPKQIPGDAYRHHQNNRKETGLILSKIKEKKAQILILQQTEKIFPNCKTDSLKQVIMAKENKSQYLRSIIQKQLFNSKRSQELAKDKIITIAHRQKEPLVQKNKYRQLLNKFYGDAKKYTNHGYQKLKQIPTSQNIKSPTLQRFKSQKKFNDIYRDNNSLKSLKYRCNSTIKIQKPFLYSEPPSTKSKQQTIKSPQLSYTQLYLRKRRPLLII